MTSEVQSRSVDLSELTLPSFTDSSKQVPLHFIRVLEWYNTSSSDTRPSQVAIDLQGSTGADSETVVF